MSLIIFMLLAWTVGVKTVWGQGDPAVYETLKNDPKRNLSSPSYQYYELEKKYFNTKTEGWRTYFTTWNTGTMTSTPGLFETQAFQLTNDTYHLAHPLWGNPPFFCIDIPKMMYEGYETYLNPSTLVAAHRDPSEDRRKIFKFNKEGVGYNTNQKRSKSRYNNAYSLFWIMEPTSHRWNRRFLTRSEAYKYLGRTPSFSIRDAIQVGYLWQQSRFVHPELDMYTDIMDGVRSTNVPEFRWHKAHEMERQRVVKEGLFWHVEVTGIRNPETKSVLKGWYHLKITLRKTTAGTTPVPKSQYVIDRLAVSARGLSFAHQFQNTAFHTVHSSDYRKYFDNNLFYNRPRRAWEGGAGEFVYDFPECKGVANHTFVERQFVPCGNTRKSQFYYGNNFIYVKTDYAEYPDPDKTKIYGDGVVTNGDTEEIHLNYKLDQSFCNMLLAVDFVVTGVVIQGNRFGDVVRGKSQEWMSNLRNLAWAVDRTSSTRIEFTQDTYVDPPINNIPAKCREPWRNFSPPIIKAGTLPPLTFYENADPIPQDVQELECFVPLEKFNPSGGGKQPEESFTGAIQGILQPETFSRPPPHRGLTLSHWYLYMVTPFSTMRFKICVKDENGECQSFQDWSQVIKDEVKEWDWRHNDPSDFSFHTTGESQFEKTQIPYLDSTHKGVWISYFDTIQPLALKEIYGDPVLQSALLKFGDDEAWPSSRQAFYASEGALLFQDPLLRGSFFQQLYFRAVPFFGRATSDTSHQLLGQGHGQPTTATPLEYFVSNPYGGEPGYSPTACDLYVSRYYLRILDQDDEQSYNKPIGEPNDPSDDCNMMTPRLTTDPALQYVRKSYVRPRSQGNGTTRRPTTWYEMNIEQAADGYEELCTKMRIAQMQLKAGMCPTMLAHPYTTPVGRIRLPPSRNLISRGDGLDMKYPHLRGLTMDSDLGLFIWDSRVIHGIWMTILTFFIIPVSVFLARFYKETWMIKRLYHHHNWYFLHVMSGFFSILVWYVGISRSRSSRAILGSSYATSAKFHIRTGSLFLIICVLIMVGGGIRTMNKRARESLIATHWYLGSLAYLCLLGCMFSSIFTQGSPSSYYDYSVYEFRFTTVIREYLLWAFILWIVFDVAMFVWMFKLGLRADRMMNLSRPRLYSPCPIPVLYEHFVFDAPLWGKRIRMLYVYVGISILFTLSVCRSLVIITPFTNPIRGFGWMTCTHYSDGTPRETYPKHCPELGGDVEPF